MADPAEDPTETANTVVTKLVGDLANRQIFALQKPPGFGDFDEIDIRLECFTGDAPEEPAEVFRTVTQVCRRTGQSHMLVDVLLDERAGRHDFLEQLAVLLTGQRSLAAAVEIAEKLKNQTLDDQLITGFSQREFFIDL